MPVRLRRIQPFLSFVDREVDFLCTNDLIVLHYSRDAANWLPSRSSLSVEMRRRYGWVRIGVPRGALSEPQFRALREVRRHARGREHCRGEPGSALSGGYAPDSAKVEGSSIVDEPGEG